MSSETDNGNAIHVTLDHNCVIDLEGSGHAAEPLRALIALHDQGFCRLQVVGIGASERKRDGTYATNFAEFTQKIAAAGLHDAVILKPLGYWGITFWDWCVYSSDELRTLEHSIHTVLFSDVEFEYAAFCASRGLDIGDPVNRKWKNAKCDVLTLWCHIHYGGGLFVTSDGNFHRANKKPHLIALGAGAITRPDEAVQALQPGTDQNSMGVR